MQTILKQLAKDFFHKPKIIYKKAKYKRTITKAANISDELFVLLDDYEKKLLKNLIKSQSKLEYLNSINHFVHGYSMGLRAATESFSLKK